MSGEKEFLENVFQYARSLESKPGTLGRLCSMAAKHGLRERNIDYLGLAIDCYAVLLQKYPRRTTQFLKSFAQIVAHLVQMTDSQKAREQCVKLFHQAGRAYALGVKSGLSMSPAPSLDTITEGISQEYLKYSGDSDNQRE